MAETLTPLIRLHSWQVDEKRRVLAGKLRHLEALMERLRAVEDELARERQIARSSPDAAIYFGNYARGVNRRREQLNQSIAGAEAEVEKAREAVRIAFSDLKKFEQAEEARERRHAAERDRRERILLDEIGIETYRRREE